MKKQLTLFSLLGAGLLAAQDFVIERNDNGHGSGSLPFSFVLVGSAEPSVTVITRNGTTVSDEAAATVFLGTDLF